MAQHDYVIDNQSFPATRTDLNNVLQAIVSNNSGTSAPSTTFANQIWYDSNANILYIRNEDNDANIPLMQFDQSADVAATLATVIDILDASGTDQAGTALTIRGGAGTGTGAGGSIILQTADGAGSTGSSVNAHATRVTITDDGKVGIGITAPEALTHIAGATADADGALGSQSPQLIIEGGNNNNPFELGMDNSGATAIGFLQSRNKSAGAQFLSLNPKGGNVGVGVATPDAKLHVKDTAASTTTHSYTKLHIEDADHLALQFSGGTSGESWIFFADDTSSTPVGGITYFHGGPYMAFRVEGSERMRIDDGGRLLIGTTSSGTTSGGAYFDPESFGRTVLFTGSDSATSGITLIAFNNPNGIVGGISTNANSTSYNTSSDYRLKENVADLTGAIDRVKTLAPKRFNFITDPDTTVDGFLAHEVTTVPEAVTGTKDETRSVSNAVLSADGKLLAEDVLQSDWTAGKLPTTNMDGDEVNALYPSDSTWAASHTEPVYQGIDQAKLVPVLTAALQEAIAKIETLETKVAALEG